MFLYLLLGFITAMLFISFAKDSNGVKIFNKDDDYVNNAIIIVALTIIFPLVWLLYICYIFSELVLLCSHKIKIYVDIIKKKYDRYN